MKLQMLQYIIYRFNQTFGNVLAQIYIHYKGLIKYNKVDGIIPMNTHVQIAHLKLFVQRKQLNKKVGNTCGSCSTIIVHLTMQLLKILMPQTPQKKINNNTNFWRIWCFIFAKVVDPCSLAKMFGF